MREQLQNRLEVLRKEFETGRAELEKVEQRRTYLRETILRIAGAIQVLEEILAQEQPAGQNGARLGGTQTAYSQAGDWERRMQTAPEEQPS